MKTYKITIQGQIDIKRKAHDLLHLLYLINEESKKLSLRFGRPQKFYLNAITKIGEV